MTLDILAIGEPLIEFNQMQDGQYRRSMGGDASNVAIAAARLGAKTGMLTRLGRDGFARQIRDIWSHEGVDSSACVDDPHGETGIYFISHGADGHQFDYRRAGSASSQLSPDDLDHHAIEAANLIHLSGISMAISDKAADACFEAVHIAKAAGRSISFDPNLRLKLWPLDRARTMIHGIMREVDIALPGLDDARLLTGIDDAHDIVAFYHDLGCPIVALTMGGEGVILSDRDTGQKIHIDQFSVDAVDATGAGDCFDGAFLTHYSQSKDLEAAGRFANAAAALSVTGYGAIDPLPTRAAVKDFLKSQT